MEIITMKDQLGNISEYKLLCIIDRVFHYVIYTDKDNEDISKNLYVAKITNLQKECETLPISNQEWQMLEDEYQRVIKAK